MNPFWNYLIDVGLLGLGVGVAASAFLLLAPRSTARTRILVVRLAMVLMLLAPLVAWLAKTPLATTSLPLQPTALLTEWNSALPVQINAFAQSVQSWQLDEHAQNLRSFVPAQELPWAPLAILAVSLFLATGILRGWLAVRRLLRRARPADAAALDTFHSLPGARASRTTLLESPEIRGAFVTGILRPRILLPITPDATAPSRQVLAHELAHVLHQDLAWHALGAFLRTAFWFQPFNWFLHARHEALAEELADAAALRAGHDELAYARELCACAGLPPMPAAGFSLLRRPSRLRRRLQRLFSPHMKTNHQLRPATALAGALMLGTALVGGVLLASLGTRLQASTATPTAPAATVATTGEKPADIGTALSAALALKGEDSIAALRALAEKHPADSAVSYWLAVRILESGKTDSAEIHFLRLLAEDRPNWATTWSAVRLAQIARLRQDGAKADDYTRQARALVARYGDGGQSIESFLGNAGFEADLKSALALEGEDALKALDRLRSAYPGNEYIDYWFAVRTLDARSIDEAERLFAALVAADRPNWVTTWSTVRLFEIAHQRKDADRAAQLEKQAEENARRHGDGGQPIADFLAAVRSPRAEVEPQLRAALALAAKDVVPALQALRAKYPADVYVTYWLAVNLRQQNAPAQALPLFEEVVARRMENWVTAWATLELARIAKDGGDADRSLALVHTAIRMGEEYGNGGQSLSKAARAASLLPNG